jgi:hypothetical protein
MYPCTLSVDTHTPKHALLQDNQTCDDCLMTRWVQVNHGPITWGDSLPHTLGGHTCLLIATAASCSASLGIPGLRRPLLLLLLLLLLLRADFGLRFGGGPYRLAYSTSCCRPVSKLSDSAVTWGFQLHPGMVCNAAVRSLSRLCCWCCCLHFSAHWPTATPWWDSCTLGRRL